MPQQEANLPYGHPTFWLSKCCKKQRHVVLNYPLRVRRLIITHICACSDENQKLSTINRDQKWIGCHSCHYLLYTSCKDKHTTIDSISWFRGLGCVISNFHGWSSIHLVWRVLAWLIKPGEVGQVLHGCPTPQCKYLMARCCMDINKWGFIISYWVYSLRL
jgi:hypothetical protein